MEAEQISENVYANVNFEGGNVACINTEAGVVLIDTPMLPADVESWKGFVAGLNPKGILYIIATHHHFDHIIGNRQLGGRVIMQETAMQKMMEKNGTLRETMVMPGMPGRSDADVAFILSEPLVHPMMTFADELTLYPGDTRIDLIHAGGHTPGSICVVLETEKILFAGDNITAGMHPYKGDGNFREWIEAIKWMNALEVDQIVPGHGPVCKAEELERFLAYFSQMYYMAEHQIRKGKSKEKIIEKVHEKMFDFFDVDPERLAAAKMMFDMGTKRLYAEIINEL